MKFTPDPRPHVLGLFELNGTESVKDVKAGVLAERARKFPDLPERLRNQFTEITIRKLPRRPSFKPPRPGDGNVTHDARTARAIAACEAVGAEFWCHGPGPSRCTGVKDGDYVEVAV